jgi:hypothetical protein
MNWTRPAAFALLPVVAVACGGDSAGTGDGESTGNSSITTATTGFTTTSETSAGTMDDTTGAVDGSTSGTTGTVMPECPTVSCGPGQCCDDDEECVIGACQPDCASGVRCGADLSVCCNEGEVCLQPNCVVPGAPCLDSYDCPANEFCEPTLGQCLPQQDPVTCEIQPMFTEIDLVLEWSAESDESITAPLVGDIDGDDLPEVVVNTFYYGGVEYQGEIVVLDGQNGNEKLRITEGQPGEHGSYSRSTPALGDVDGNGLADIIYPGYPQPSPYLNRSHVYAIDATGQELFVSHAADMSPHPVFIRTGAITAANFDQDAESEIVVGIWLMDNDGLVVHDLDSPLVTGTLGDGGLYGTNNGYLGGVSAVADLTDDGIPEVISGSEAWSVDWVDPAFGPPDVTVTQLWSTMGDDGYPAIADFDDNGSPEVALVANGYLIILDGQTGQLWCGRDPTGFQCAGNNAARTQPYLLPNPGAAVVNRGGPATIADFDGDGRVEVGVAGASAYTVFDFNRPTEEIVQPVGDPPPGPGDIFTMWSQPTQDITSNATGSAVFDFQGDGIAEVMYQDECYARVYDGRTGAVLIELMNSSATIHEYPVVADVDGDNNSEFIVVANDNAALNDGFCSQIPNYMPRRGVFVYGDANDQWVPTRDIWTQHTYHVTNATSAALTPPIEANNWQQVGLNNYRQNVQGEGVFNASDLTVEVAVGFSGCLDAEFQIVVTVRNNGSLGVPPGVNVTLYEGTDENGMLISSQQTMQALLPGEFVQLVWLVPAPADVAKTFYVAVDDADLGGTGMINECDESNNTATTETVACPTPG